MMDMWRTKHNRHGKGLLVALLSVVLFFGCVVGLAPSVAKVNVHADTAKYTSVLEDLGKDTSFSASNYPDVKQDYSLQVIQIAESAEKELFVYVYQPSHATKDLIATGIRFSTGINSNAFWQDYSLELVSTKGTLDKYLVKDFKVLSDALRYYDVPLLHRAWDASIDEPVSGGMVDNVPSKVAALFTASTIDGKVSYSRTETKVIEITDKFVGFCRYSNGFHLYVSSCDAHFIAFSTDYNIDKLLEADVSWQMQEQTTYIDSGYISRGEFEDKSATLRYTDIVENTGNGLFSKTYKWERIESVAKFLIKEDLTSETRTAMANKQWVLRFYETPYTLNGVLGFKNLTAITKVTILRLKFEIDGKTYNLGVVDNKQSGDDNPDNNNTNELDVLGWLLRLFLKLVGLLPWWAWLIIGIILFGSILAILSFVFPVVLKVILFLLKVIWWIICLPVRILIWLFKFFAGLFKDKAK